jgi:hypothetical protein
MMKKPRRKIDAALKAKIALVFETALARSMHGGTTHTEC